MTVSELKQNLMNLMITYKLQEVDTLEKCLRFMDSLYVDQGLWF